ncbi:GreA/GreB family elongation factor [Streptomyces sp. MZ04]|uniref:GreA/GreB family elongation factor n=1 Tax=Streptomyces sp. MZ04 TaxID=2559236 RepID=UPI00107E6822|nr:GreA/GreB family elongation factor [Streptomyces sp. MZ04]TGB15847.1 nucleoside diphosphate kinase regulator [Streptomyces sp. MZ04]
MNGDPQPISATARRALEKELADLRAERNADAATLQDTSETGDRADQADELRRLAVIGRLDDRITEITLRLRQADDAGPPSTDEVGMGSTVTVRFSDGSVGTVEISEVAEPLEPTMVTYDSPMGRALLGHRAGDSVSYKTPGGEAAVTIVSLGETGPAGEG